MKNSIQKTHILLRIGLVLLVGIVSALSAQAAPTFWTGTNITFTKAKNDGKVDVIVPGVVGFTRGLRFGIYNALAEPSATIGSPSDTEWAVGAFSNALTLTYSACPIKQGGQPATLIGRHYVVHIKPPDDIYFSFTLTGWGNGNPAAGGNPTMSYTRSTPAIVSPTVTITNPVTGSTFASPADVHITASASVAGGTVTNVQFVQNGNIVIGSITNPPFTITATNLSAGSYPFTAIATAGGLSTTSAVVTISVVDPVQTALTTPTANGNQLIFDFATTPNLKYVVQTSPDLSTWTPLFTNVATGSSTEVTNTIDVNTNAYFRVVRLANP